MPHPTQLRESPQFVICDERMRVVCSSPHVDGDLLLDRALLSLESRCRESRRSRTVLFETYDDNSVVRIIPLAGKNTGCVALFIETLDRRGSLSGATKNFGLTKREAQVLPLILRGTTNSRIADILCVSESTIGDHVKNIMRKMETSNRIGILHKAFNLEVDMPQPNEPPA
jgi:DNA-binding CsgD family transcriptional regulator